MTNLKNLLLNICEREIPTTEKGLQQTARNNLKTEIMQTFTQALKNELQADYIEVMQTKDGIGIRLDNENVGFINMVVDLSIKNFDYDLDFEHESYEDKLQEQAEKRAEKERLKAEKIKRDTERRAKLKKETE